MCRELRALPMWAFWNEKYNRQDGPTTKTTATRSAAVADALPVAAKKKKKKKNDALHNMMMQHKNNNNKNKNNNTNIFQTPANQGIVLDDDNNDNDCPGTFTMVSPRIIDGFLLTPLSCNDTIMDICPQQKQKQQQQHDKKDMPHKRVRSSLQRRLRRKKKKKTYKAPSPFCNLTPILQTIAVS